MGATVSTILRIRNLTNNDITSIFGYDFDNFDFGSDLRPDKIFKKVSIPAGCHVERQIELNLMASNCPFAMKITFANGAVDIFKMNYKFAYDGTQPNLRHFKKSHRICYERKGARVLEFTVQHTEEQMQNLRAEELNQEGMVLMAAEKYNEASIKFLEASQKANQDETRTSIRNNQKKLEDLKVNDDEKAKPMINEGLHLLKENKYKQALDKFGEARKCAKKEETINIINDNMKITREAIVNQDAKKLNQEGLILRKNDQNGEAIIKFDEALKAATDKTLINSIKTNKAETRNKQANLIFEETWSDDTDESIHKIAKAKFLFQEAYTLKSNSEYQKNITLIDIKLEGDKCVNIGVQLEKEGSRLIDKAIKSELSIDYKIARGKFEEALKQYEEAKKKFEEGDAKFEPGIKINDEAINRVAKNLKQLEEAEKQNFHLL